MKKGLIVLCSVAVGIVLSALGQTSLVISSFDRTSGQLVFNEIENATNYYVMRSTDLSAGWTPAGGALDDIPTNGLGSITCWVPVADPACFYRVAANINTNTTPPALPPFIELASIPSGTYYMGDYLWIWDDATTEHPVDINAFEMGKYEVTKAEWDTAASWASDHGYDIDIYDAAGKGTNHPAYYITWYEAVKWCNALSEREGRTPCYELIGNVYRAGIPANPSADLTCDWDANGYRLPTEAEWEWAAQAGVDGRWFPWDGLILHGNANYMANTHAPHDATTYTDSTYHPTYAVGAFPYTSPVGDFAANSYGLYDMAGNVYEWCWDWYDAGYYAVSGRDNPKGPGAGTYRVARGGAFNSLSYYCHVYGRGNASPTYDFYDELGFRVVRAPDPAE